MSATDTTRTYGRRYAWSLVLGFTVASVVLNAAHAILGMDGRSGPEQSLSAAVAVVAPVSLLLATHLVVGLIRDWSRRRRWVTRLRALCAATTVGIGLIAFATSFVALMDMAALMGVPAAMTWALPAVVDAMIVIATLAVVVAEAEIALDQTEAAEDDRRAAEAARVAEDQAAAQAAARVELTAQQATLGAVQHPVQQGAGTTGAEPAEPVQQEPVARPSDTGDGRPLDTPEVPNDSQLDTDQPVSDEDLFNELVAAFDADGQESSNDGRSPNGEVNGWTERPMDTAEPFAERALDTEDPAAEHPVMDTPEVFAERALDTPQASIGQVTDAAERCAAESVERSMDTAEQSPLDTPQALAEQVKVEANSRVEVQVITEVLGLTDEGLSRRAVAERVGLSPSTVSSLVRVATELRDGGRSPEAA